MNSVDKLDVKIFADGADKAGILEMYGKPYIKGFTTNPTLMRKVGITDYKAFAKDVQEIKTLEWLSQPFKRWVLLYVLWGVCTFKYDLVRTMNRFCTYKISNRCNGSHIPYIPIWRSKLRRSCAAG